MEPDGPYGAGLEFRNLMVHELNGPELKGRVRLSPLTEEEVEEREEVEGDQGGWGGDGDDGRHSFDPFVRSFDMIGRGLFSAPLPRSPLRQRGSFDRSLLRRLDRRPAREEVCANGVGLLGRHDPCRTLGIDRTRERAAQERTNELPVHAELCRQSLGPNGRAIRLGHRTIVCDRSNDVKPIVERISLSATATFVVTYDNMVGIPPCLPPKVESLRFFEIPRAKRAGPEIFGAERAA